MQKLQDYENTYYENRWYHEGFTVCELKSDTYLIFDSYNEMKKCCGSLEQAEKYINENLK